MLVDFVNTPVVRDAEVVLHDVDPLRLERIGHVLDGLAAEHGSELPFRATTDLVDAVEGADFVFCAIRVGQLEGRVVDALGPGHCIHDGAPRERLSRTRGEPPRDQLLAAGVRRRHGLSPDEFLRQRESL